MNSTDSNQKIYIREDDRIALFNKLLNAEQSGEKITKDSWYWTTNYLETICLGKTYLSDSAYSPIRAALKREYKKWRAENDK